MILKKPLMVLQDDVCRLCSSRGFDIFSCTTLAHALVLSVLGAGRTQLSALGEMFWIIAYLLIH